MTPFESPGFSRGEDVNDFRDVRPGDTVTVRKPNGMLSDITVAFVGSRDSPSCGRSIGDDENHVFYENEGCTVELISRPDLTLSAELAELRTELSAARAAIAAADAWNSSATPNQSAGMPSQLIKYDDLDDILTGAAGHPAINAVIASNLREAASFLYEELAGQPQQTRALARDLLLGEAQKFETTSAAAAAAESGTRR